MICTRIHAHTLRALLPSHTVVSVAAGSATLPLVAHIATTVEVRVADAIRSHTAIGIATKGRLETQWTIADGLPIHHFTQGIRATRRLARIHTASMQAGRVLWTILVAIRTDALRATARGVGIAHLIRGTLAHMSIRSRLATGRRVTGILFTAIESNAFDLRQWIGAISRRTLTHSPMVVSNTHGIVATGLFIAHIVAGVGESVAELRSRTIDVVHTWHAATTVGLVVWVAGKRSWRTLALGIMIVGDANRMGSTLDSIARWTTLHDAIITYTSLRFGTFSVRGALATQLSATSITVVGVARVPAQAVATALVVLGHAHGVRGTRELEAHSYTLGHA